MRREGAFDTKINYTIYKLESIIIYLINNIHSKWVRFIVSSKTVKIMIKNRVYLLIL